MSKLYQTIMLFVIAVLVISCATPTTDQPAPPILPEAKIDRHPEPANFDVGGYFVLPKYDPESDDPFQMDLRSRDLSAINLSNRKDDLLYTTFDSRTQWPSFTKMPLGFDWKQIMEIGKDPGLGIRVLHEQGITGKGISIAIIDQTLLVDHIEYRDRIRVYEEADDIGKDWSAAMHGPAVASIAVGKTVGVAPGADLYYIATESCGGDADLEYLDFSCRAKAIQRIIEINKSLPANRKIRVLSMSFGWWSKSKGYDEITAAVNEAKSAGIFVISSSIGQTYELYFQGLGRDPLNDPDQFESYSPGLWWKEGYFANPLDYYFGDPPQQMLMVPMDSRTTASPTGTEDYAFYREGGWSWSIPYLAGTYALAAQVNPEITPEEFWQIALETGRTTQIQHDGKDYNFGVILDPQALISALKSK